MAIVAPGVFLVPADAGELGGPFRASVARKLSPVVQQLVERRAIQAPRDSESVFALTGEMSALLTLLEPAADAERDSDEIDISEALVTDAQRTFALAVEKWLAAPVKGAEAAERRRQRAAVAAFYSGREYETLWREGENWRPEAATLAQRLHEAAEDGLDLRSYLIPVTDHGSATAEAELDLSEAIAAYAAQASGSRVDPQRFSKLIGARPTPPQTGAVLAAVAEAGSRAADVLQDFNPPHAGYRALKAKLAELRSSRAFEDIRLADASGDSPRHDASPAPKARRQAPLAGKRSRAHVEAEIIANMERWRWLPRDLGETRIEVNIPDFELALVRDGVVAHRARVIVGKETTPTPIFSDQMEYIIVNPYWNVPPSILNKEMLPKYGGDLAALEQSGFQVSYRNGRISLRQRPGDRNALGRIKFIFPNDFSVYLHDTPSRALFAQSHRAFSHGCMRVDQPFRLAEELLGPGSGWSEERLRRLIGGSERYIHFSQPLPIHVEYFTAYVDETGRLQLRNDLYGYSARVRAALGLEG